MVDRTSEINLIRTVLGRLEFLERLRDWEIGAAVDHQSDHALRIIVHEQDDRLSEVRIGKIATRYQQLSGAQVLDVLALDGKDRGRVFRRRGTYRCVYPAFGGREGHDRGQDCEQADFVQ